MTTATLREQAARIRPGQVAATVIGTVIGTLFFAIGWVAGIIWRGIVIVALALWHYVILDAARAARVGYWKGAGIPTRVETGSDAEAVRPAA